MEKEARRIELALAECIFEKSEVTKELRAQRETLNEVIKQNTVLNEELKVKDEIIKALSENNKEPSMNQAETTAKDDTTNKETRRNSTENFKCNECSFVTNGKTLLMEHIIEHTGQDKQKCKSCDFEPRIPGLLKGHNIAHTGQYQCMRGCKLAFKSLSLLDEHIKLQHPEPKASEYKCDKCDVNFNAQFQLRQHISKKHSHKGRQEQTRTNCELCGQMFANSNELKTHMETCDQGFIKESKECYYYNRGQCWKGESCKFTHNKSRSIRRTPQCYNGDSCRYLASGVCRFFHPKMGVQNPTEYTEERNVFCKYFEDCRRVPNCPYSHSEQDFPELQKSHNPPLGARRIAKDWEEY